MVTRVFVAMTAVLTFIGACATAQDHEGPYCGIYAMYGAASALGQRRPFDELIDPQFVSGFQGSTAEDLDRCAVKLGVKSRLLTALGSASLRSTKEPLILHVASHGYLQKYNHWLLFLGMHDNNTCRIADERGHVTQVPLADILARWDGSAILVSKTDIPESNLDQPEFVSVAVAALLVIGLIGLSTWLSSRNVSQGARSVAGAATFAGIAFLPFVIDAASPAGLLRNPQLSAFIFRALHPRDFDEIRVSELRDLVKNDSIQVIDARYSVDFGSGHLQGSINIPVNSSYGDFLKTTSSLERDRPIVIYCQSEGCRFSDHVAIALVSQGFEDIRIFRGGWVEWQQQQYLTK